MKKLVSCLLIGSALLASCSKQLDIPQHGNVSTLEEYYKTDDEVESAVAAMYSQLKDLHFQFFYTLTSLDDDSWTGGMTRGDNSNMEKLNEFTFDASHEWLKSCYSDFYKLIYKASLITEHVEGDSQVARRAIFEARVMRALANFYLVAMWGNAPMVDHVLKPEEYRVTNSSPAAFWESIETDLNDAITSGLLPEQYYRPEYRHPHHQGVRIRPSREGLSLAEEVFRGRCSLRKGNRFGTVWPVRNRGTR